MPPAAFAPGLPMTQIPRSAAAETEQHEFDIDRTTTRGRSPRTFPDRQLAIVNVIVSASRM
jgi:hypothetical protein